MKTKVVSLSEAIRRYVSDGQSLVLGTGLEGFVPFAAGYEIIRQGKRNLCLVGPISDILFDLLIGAGCVSKVVAAWVGNVSAGLGYNFRRAVEESTPHPLEVENHSNFTIALGLHAAALGIPFIPARTGLGTDLQRQNPHLQEMSCPYTGERLVAVRAITPDVAIVHVQRADGEGNCHLWGNLGVTLDAVRASRTVIVTTEEIVSSDVILSDPNRTLIPGIFVTAIALAPWGAHPSPVVGYYNRDHEFFHDYHEQTRTREQFLDWLREWVLQPADHEAYLRKLGTQRLNGLRPKRTAPSVPVSFGY